MFRDRVVDRELLCVLLVVILSLHPRLLTSVRARRRRIHHTDIIAYILYIVAMPIHSLAHDQCPPFGIVLGPLHLPHQLEVGRDGRAAMTRPLQVVEHHYIEGVGMVL